MHSMLPNNRAGQYSNIIGYGPHPTSQMVPMVIEDAGRGERSYDIFSRLLESRIIFINGGVADEMSHVINAQLLHLDASNAGKKDEDIDPIKLYINSPGGVVTAGLSIYDTMQLIKTPVHTYCMGQACSMGSVILAGGEPGHRYATPHARIMVHQPSGGFSGTHQDIQIHAREMERIQEIGIEIYMRHCGMTRDEVLASYHAGDNFMSPQEAMKFGKLGLIDQVAE